MKKIIILFATLLLLTDLFASNKVIEAPKKASAVFIYIDNPGRMMSLEELSQITKTDMEIFLKRKLSVLEAIAFHIFQKKLKKNINSDGTVNNKFLKKLAKRRDGTTGFHAGGFFLGLLLGPFGLLIAYIAKDEKRKNRIKWAWLGFLVLVIFAILAASSGGFYY